MPYWHIDTGMASLLILQTAVDEGLGACFFGIPSERIAPVPRGVRRAGGVQADRRDHRRAPARGRGRSAQGSPSRRARKPAEEVVHRGGW